MTTAAPPRPPRSARAGHPGRTVDSADSAPPRRRTGPSRTAPSRTAPTPGQPASPGAGGGGTDGQGRRAGPLRSSPPPAGAGRRAGPGLATARAVPQPGPPAADPRPDLRLVEQRRPVRPGLLGTVAVSGAFIALFVLAALQAALVQGQLRLDRLHADVNQREADRDRLALQVNTLESPERLARAAQDLGMVRAPDAVYLYAPLPGGSASEVVPSAGPTGGRAELAETDMAESDTVRPGTATAGAEGDIEGGAENGDGSVADGHVGEADDGTIVAEAADGRTVGGAGE